MHTSVNLSMITPLMALAMPLAASVLVSSPVNGSTVTAPVLYTASATTTTCSKGVGSMGVYVDNRLIHVSAGTKLNASLAVPSGKHQTVVEEWDRCGRASFTKLSIIVTPSSKPLVAATPAFSLPSGAYTSAQTVTLTDATPGARIYYTLDGTSPTPLSLPYLGAIAVTSTETVRAIATSSGYSQSPVASATYLITLYAATPAFSLAPGTYTAVQSVALSDSTPGAAIRFTTNGTAPTAASQLYAVPISIGATETLMAIATAPGYSNSGMARADYVIALPSTGPYISPNAVSSTQLQLHSNWKFNHDPGTPGSSVGAMSVVSSPSLSGSAAEFGVSYTDWGGEIYHLSFGIDAAPTHFVYDAQVWIVGGSKIGNLEMDMNQVIPNGDTVIYGFQCDGDHGTWDYSANKVSLVTSRISWRHSQAPCNPAKWTTDAWHHVQISYSRDEVGNVTYDGVWLDGVEAALGITVPSAESLHWAHGDLLTNFQVDGIGAAGTSVLYVDNLTIYRW